MSCHISSVALEIRGYRGIAGTSLVPSRLVAHEIELSTRIFDHNKPGVPVRGGSTDCCHSSSDIFSRSGTPFGYEANLECLLLREDSLYGSSGRGVHGLDLFPAAYDDHAPSAIRVGCGQGAVPIHGIWSRVADRENSPTETRRE